MYQKERLNGILKILETYGYVPVKHLVSQMHYSNATINRDLNQLEAQGLIKRSYGGVELLETAEMKLPFRYHKMHVEKIKLAQAAADLVQDGDTVFIDAATTTEPMADFLLEKKDITVITNNLAIVMRLSEHNIKAICLGGKVLEPPCMLDGLDTVENAEKYHADKMFFATGYVCEEGGWIGEGTGYFLLHQTMAKNSQKVFYLADHEKFERSTGSRRKLMDFSALSGMISDREVCESVKKKYPNMQFIKV